MPDTRITTAGMGHAADLRLRRRRYLMTQAVRVACVLLAVLLPVAPHWKIGFIALSVVLPWVGVVAANGGPTVERHRETAVVTRPEPFEASRPTLDAGRVIDAD